MLVTNYNGYDLGKRLYTEFIDSSKYGSMVNVLTTIPNRRARSTVCLTVRGSDGSEQVLLVSIGICHGYKVYLC